MRTTPVLLALAMLAVGGCGPSAPTSPSPGPLRITVTQNSSFAPNGAAVAMRLDNISPNPVDLSFPSSCDILPAFTDAAGRPVVPSDGFACLTVITQQQLQPGGFLFRDIYVQTTTAGGATTILPPGSYTIAA